MSLTNPSIDHAVRLDPIGAASPCTQKCLRVASIGLTVRNTGAGTTVTAKIVIRDERWAVVPNIRVTVTWTTPQGVVQGSAVTNAAGAATFTTRGAHGSYQITVSGAVRAGYTFDPAHSKLLTKLITA